MESKDWGHPYDNQTAKKVIEEHGAEIKEMFDYNDNETKRYLDVIFNMVLSGEDDLYEPMFYENTGKSVNYFCDAALAPNGDVTLVDVGAFEGESIEPIRKFYGHRFKRCLAFEPNSNSYEKLRSYIKESGLDAITTTYPYALGDKEEMIHFSETGLVSKQSESGNVELKQVVFDNLKIDLVVGKAMVKMDIEGAEEKALIGMREFITKEKPFLAICLYHKEEDLYKLPKLIKEFYPGYQMYIRGGGILNVGQCLANKVNRAA